ncbi:MAG: hypothetical protein AVDCRST_MAG54-1613, partial [uncultured Actinomycetospora sp.]
WVTRAAEIRSPSVPCSPRRNRLQRLSSSRRRSLIVTAR